MKDEGAGKAPNPNHQTPENNQIPITNQDAVIGYSLGFDAWDLVLFPILWLLELGVWCFSYFSLFFTASDRGSVRLGLRLRDHFSGHLRHPHRRRWIPHGDVLR